MDSVTTRLITCFRSVFPDLAEAEITGATQSTLAAWDSIATITLVNVIEEEFSVQMDFDRLPELDSFARIEQYLREVLA